MNALLEHVHYRLYNKIQLQQEIVDEFYSLGEKLGLALKEECNKLFGTFENRPLEEMTDHDNIHGWLQEWVSQVEYKYAYCVTKLLNKYPETKDSLKAISANNGTNLAITMKELPMDPTGVYQLISDSLLDCVPRDSVNRILEQTDKEILWERSICVHNRYWDEVGGEVRIYYELREDWMAALVRELGFHFRKIDKNTYCICAVGAD